jgi:hypothetical protein
MRMLYEIRALAQSLNKLIKYKWCVIGLSSTSYHKLCETQEGLCRYTVTWSSDVRVHIMYTCSGCSIRQSRDRASWHPPETATPPPTSSNAMWFYFRWRQRSKIIPVKLNDTKTSSKFFFKNSASLKLYAFQRSNLQQLFSEIPAACTANPPIPSPPLLEGSGAQVYFRLEITWNCKVRRPLSH